MEMGSTQNASMLDISLAHESQSVHQRTRQHTHSNEIWALLLLIYHTRRETR